MNWTDSWAALLWPITIANNLLFQSDMAYIVPVVAAVYFSGIRTVPNVLPPVMDLAKGYAAGAGATYIVRYAQRSPGGPNDAVLARFHGP
jgi:hypothetical protein